MAFNLQHEDHDELGEIFERSLHDELDYSDARAILVEAHTLPLTEGIMDPVEEQGLYIFEELELNLGDEYLFDTYDFDDFLIHYICVHMAISSDDSNASTEDDDDASTEDDDDASTEVPLSNGHHSIDQFSQIFFLSLLSFLQTQTQVLEWVRLPDHRSKDLAVPVS